MVDIILSGEIMENGDVVRLRSQIASQCIRVESIRTAFDALTSLMVSAEKDADRIKAAAIFLEYCDRWMPSEDVYNSVGTTIKAASDGETRDNDIIPHIDDGTLQEAMGRALEAKVHSEVDKQNRRPKTILQAPSIGIESE